MEWISEFTILIIFSSLFSLLFYQIEIECLRYFQKLLLIVFHFVMLIATNVSWNIWVNYFGVYRVICFFFICNMKNICGKTHLTENLIIFMLKKLKSFLVMNAMRCYTLQCFRSAVTLKACWRTISRGNLNKTEKLSLHIQIWKTSFITLISILQIFNAFSVFGDKTRWNFFQRLWMRSLIIDFCIAFFEKLK